jgi:hypothetical protein
VNNKQKRERKADAAQPIVLKGSSGVLNAKNKLSEVLSER